MSDMMKKKIREEDNLPLLLLLKDVYLFTAYLNPNVIKLFLIYSHDGLRLKCEGDRSNPSPCSLK